VETIRRVIRNILGYDSGLYRAGATALDFLSTASKEGIKTWRILDDLKNNMRNGEPPQSVILKNLNYPILIRPGTLDAATIINIVMREEYGHFSFIKEPEWMIDAGAYIGDTTAYFLSRYPRLKVIALEPNPDSFEMAKRNLQQYGERAILLKKGLFSCDQVQCFSGRETGASISSSGFEIECTTISSLLEYYSIPYVDILKMDIEGAEGSIFSYNPEAWLNHIGVLIVEIHGSQNQALISRVLSKNRFSMKRYRSIFYCCRDDR